MTVLNVLYISIFILALVYGIAIVGFEIGWYLHKQVEKQIDIEV